MDGKSVEEVMEYYNNLSDFDWNLWYSCASEEIRAEVLKIFATQTGRTRHMDRMVIRQLQKYNFEELQRAKVDHKELRELIMEHRLKLRRIAMQKIEIINVGNDDVLLKFEDINMSCLRRTDVNNIIHSSEIERELSRIYRTEVHIKKDELEYVTCETAPQELVFDGGSELVANLKPEWAEKIPKISIKNILFSYEKYLKTFQNARILELESYAPMDLEVILSAVPHLMELKCTGGAITCEDSDLATWTANTECFASLECTLDEFSSVTCDGIANMIQNIKCSDNARIHIRNYKGRKFQTYCRVFESLLISSAYARKDPDQKSRWGSCEFQRTDGKIIRLFLDGPNVDD